MISRIRDYPKHLHIGENIWEVRFCRRIPDEPESTLGICDPSEYAIYIRLNQTAKERFKTLVHEICHAMCYEYNIKENHDVIHKLEEPIARLLADNGLFF